MSRILNLRKGVFFFFFFHWPRGFSVLELLIFIFAFPFFSPRIFKVEGKA